jgi:CBS domain-containing protein
LVEVFIYSVVTSAILFSVSLFAKWACKTDNEGSPEEGSYDNTLSSQFNCNSGYYNEIFKILLGSREDAIRGILTNPSAYDPRTLFTVGALFFVLMSITFGVSVPSGIFMPSILTGSALGGFAGICFQKYFIASLDPSTFALLGAAALLAGIQRNTVSLCVILMEGTGETKVLIPLIVTICVANYVGSLFNEGLYEILIEMKGYLYLEHGAKRSMDVVKISDLMSHPVECVFTVETAGAIEELLLSTSHNGFPVVDKESGQFVGLVRRDQLVALLECGIFMEECRENSAGITDRRSLPPSILVGNHIASMYEQQRLHDPTSAAPATVFGADCWLRETVQPLNGLITLDADDTLPKGIFPAKDDTIVTLRDGKLVVLLADNDRRQLVNVAAIMNRGAYSVPEMFPLSKCYSMFTALGLRHLVVLGKGGKVSGMITRYNLSPSYLEKKLKFKLP